MPSGIIKIEKKDPVATVTIDRPEKNNAITFEMFKDLRQVFAELSVDEAVRVVILRGGGRKFFSTGADVHSLMKHAHDISSEDNRADIQSTVNCEKPVLSMIYGNCCGGAVGMIAACDMRYAADNSRFWIPAAELGVVYPVEACRDINALIGPGNLSEMLHTARHYTADEVRAMGLINRAYPEEELETAVYGIAEKIAENAPFSLSGSKKIVSHIKVDPGLESSSDVEKLVGESFLTQDFQEGIKAFIEKRKPRFQGK